MARGKTNPQARRNARNFIVEQPPRDISVAEVYRRFQSDPRYKGSDISKRTFQDVAKEIEEKSDIPPFPYEDEEISNWQRWDDKNRTDEEKLYLLSLDGVSEAVDRERLRIHERNWACRIRLGLIGLTWWEQYCFVKEYARREVIAYRFEEEIDVVDLDAIIQYKPWLPHGNLKAYTNAIRAQIIPEPNDFSWGDYPDIEDGEIVVPDYWGVAQRMLQFDRYDHDENDLVKFWDGFQGEE